MKFHRAACLAVGLLSAGASASVNLRARDQCPVGFTQSVYYITVTATPTASLAPAPTTLSTIVSTPAVVPEPLSTSSTSTPEAPPAPASSTPSSVIEPETTTAVASASPILKEPSTPEIIPAPSAANTLAAVLQGPSVVAEPTTSTSTPASTSSTSSAGTTTALPGSSPNSGEATFYGGNLAGGACSFSTYTLPAGLFGTALSDSNWDDAGNCGACVSVTGPSGNSIKAMITDECPGCGTNHLDLFPDGFSSLADKAKGVIDVTWEFVPCGISSPIQLHNKEGVSQYWFSMQVVNANLPVASLEVSTDGGASWQSTTRTDYNFFEKTSGFGADAVDVRVTSSTGSTIVVNAVQVADSASTTASSNFS